LLKNKIYRFLLFKKKNNNPPQMDQPSTTIKLLKFEFVFKNG